MEIFSPLIQELLRFFTTLFNGLTWFIDATGPVGALAFIALPTLLCFMRRRFRRGVFVLFIHITGWALVVKTYPVVGTIMLASAWIIALMSLLQQNVAPRRMVDRDLLPGA